MASAIKESKSFVYNQCEVVKFEYIWTIAHFSHRTEPSDIKSSTFSAGDTDDSKWILHLYPRGTPESVSLFLRLESCCKENVYVAYDLSILNAKSEEAFTKTDSYRIYMGSSRGHNDFIKRVVLFDKGNGLLTDDELKILCRIKITSEGTNIPGQSIDIFKLPDQELSADFGNLLENKNFADVTLVVDGQEIQAHKSVLAARSSVFATMFTQVMEEQKTNRVVIIDIERKVAEEMLRFIYSGKVLNLDEMAKALLYAADKYALESLKVMCEKSLFDKLSVESAINTLKIADIHNADKLKAQTFKFINAHANMLMETEAWENLIKSHPHLIAEGYRAMAKNE